MKIYEIEQAILDCVDMETGEIIDIDKFHDLHMERKTKLDNIACLYKHLLAMAEAIKAEEQKLSERRKKHENNAEHIKAWLAEYLNGEKLETPRNSINWRKSESISIIDEKAISKQYTQIIETIKIDKAAIKNAIKDGISVTGAELISKNNIQIK